MYRRIFRVLRASRGKKLVVLVVVANYFPLTTLLCLCHHMGYHVVTPAHHQSAPPRKWTEQQQAQISESGLADDATSGRRDEFGGLRGGEEEERLFGIRATETSSSEPVALPWRPWWRQTPRSSAGRTLHPGAPFDTQPASAAVIFSDQRVRPKGSAQPSLLAEGRSGNSASSFVPGTDLDLGRPSDNPAAVTPSPGEHPDEWVNFAALSSSTGGRSPPPSAGGPAARKDTAEAERPQPATRRTRTPKASTATRTRGEAFTVASIPTPMVVKSSGRRRKRSRAPPRLRRTNRHATSRASSAEHQTTPPREPIPFPQAAALTSANHQTVVETTTNHREVSQTPQTNHQTVFAQAAPSNHRAARQTLTSQQASSQTPADYRAVLQTPANRQVDLQTPVTRKKAVAQTPTNHQASSQTVTNHQADLRNSTNSHAEEGGDVDRKAGAGTVQQGDGDTNTQASNHPRNIIHNPQRPNTPRTTTTGDVSNSNDNQNSNDNDDPFVAVEADVTPNIPLRVSGGNQDGRVFPKTHDNGEYAAAVSAAPIPASSGNSRKRTLDFPEASKGFDRPARFFRAQPYDFSQAHLAHGRTYEQPPSSYNDDDDDDNNNNVDDSGGGGGSDDDGGANDNSAGSRGAIAAPGDATSRFRVPKKTPSGVGVVADLSGLAGEETAGLRNDNNNGDHDDDVAGGLSGSSSPPSSSSFFSSSSFWLSPSSLAAAVVKMVIGGGPGDKDDDSRDGIDDGGGGGGVIVVVSVGDGGDGRDNRGDNDSASIRSDKALEQRDRRAASRRKRELPITPGSGSGSSSGPDLDPDPGSDRNFDLDPDPDPGPSAAALASATTVEEREGGEPITYSSSSSSSSSSAGIAPPSVESSNRNGKWKVNKRNSSGYNSNISKTISADNNNNDKNSNLQSATTTNDNTKNNASNRNHHKSSSSNNRIQPQTKKSTHATSLSSSSLSSSSSSPSTNTTTTTTTKLTTMTTTKDRGKTRRHRDDDSRRDDNSNNNDGYCDDSGVVKIGVILPFRGKLPFVLQKTHPALELAVEHVAREGILGPRNVSLVLRDSFCSETYGPLQGIDLYVQKAAHVFLGPACDYAVAPLARFSFRWQIPILTAGALVSAFQDRREYRLLTRVQGAYSKAGEFVQSVFNNFNWSWAGMMYHDPRDSPNQARSDCYFKVEAIFLTLRNAFGAEPWHSAFNAERPDVDYGEQLRDVSHAARVVVLCSSPDSVREIMIKAHDLNFDNGEYVFFNIDLFSSKNDSQKPWYRKSDTPERNAKARKAYEALMTVTLRKPTSPEYRQFSNDVKERARAMYPNFTYGEEEVNSFVGAFHDAVLLYALALNETLENQGSISDGAAITKRMWNRTFEGITGNVSIDGNGDRNADYSLLDLNPVTGEFEVVANYYGNKKRYEPVPGKSIHWAGGRKEAPPDTPLCGFDGSKCPPEEPFPEYGIVIIVLGSTLLIVIIAIFVIYRHIKLEAELAEMNWRVRWEDILFGSPEKNKKLERQGSKLSLVKRGSCPSSASGDTLAFQLSDTGNRQLFTKTGYYKGAIIAIKSIVRTNITISKPLLLEIKRMKDLQNDHIVRFLGACIDYPNQCLLTEYCPKGSLQDVLENDQIKLDWMFRYSIMQDIVRGMAYLHGTDLRSHGNLKSTNCVVDSRFVVKITDFGLHYFRHNPEGVEEENSFSNYHSKLWTAPELLRMQCRPAEGTPKGDVYSFAIICQEIVYRNGVFYLANLDLTPHEIYGKVRNGLRPYFRPTLEEYDCPCDELAHVISRCWAEDPSDRPDFTQLKTIIRKLNREGDKGNILDNLLSRMEQYANNLEALVEERTADYLQQKKKAEDLLYNMLPRSVALQLIRGESVTAESFDNVSIYFSDICGFTAMSAESTPMQVVDLLNDLYTTFDSIIENFDVYKVETIGDAYMVVSGLPEKNGDLHAREIARMSLMLLEAVLSFRIRHRPSEQLKLRIGIHSGPVCTGVVGHKMPRYCLFGDTVNTASRMESNGSPLRIHLSNTTKMVLDRFGTFLVESRGEVSMKGKGTMLTWWLLGERPIQDSPGGGAALNIL